MGSQMSITNICPNKLPPPPHLQDVFNLASSSGTFPPEMLKAVIFTIPKPNKDPISPANYRPISLLSTDIKIFAELLALRL